MAEKRKLLDEFVMWSVYRPERELGDRLHFWSSRNEARNCVRILGGKVKRVRVKVYEE